MTGGNALLIKLKNEFDPTIVPVLTEQSVGRQLMPVNPTLSNKGLGVLTIDNLRYVARSGAITNYDVQKDIEDTIDIESAQIRIPVQQDMVRIKYRDWLAYQNKKIAIENDISTDMTAKIAREQDKIIVDGWKPQGSAYLIKGMYQVAGNSVTGADSGTYGNVKSAASAAISKLKTSGVYSAGYNLEIASFNYAELMDSENSTGKPEAPAVLEILNAAAPNGSQPGQIIEVPDLAAGTAMVSPIASQANLRFFDIIETQVPENDLWYEGGNPKGDILMSQVGALVPRFKHLDQATQTDPCVCKITALGTS
ncbi:MAG: hypothetical protein PHW84_01895 [Methanosarcina sp.]|nr:hypothetical protein [Methanosarcina sp.]